MDPQAYICLCLASPLYMRILDPQAYCLCLASLLNVNLGFASIHLHLGSASLHLHLRSASIHTASWIDLQAHIRVLNLQAYVLHLGTYLHVESASIHTASWLHKHFIFKLTKSKSSFSTVSTVTIFPENFLAKKEATSLWQSFLQAM